MIKIIGLKGYIKNIEKFIKKTDDFVKKHNMKYQVFNADMIYGKDHITSSVNHATRAFKHKTNTTNSLEMEILLYSSGERQIKLAIQKMGVKEGQGNIAIVFIYDNLIKEQEIDKFLEQNQLKRDDDILKGNINTLNKFGITMEEIENVSKEKQGDLILERIAKVDILK